MHDLAETVRHWIRRILRLSSLKGPSFIQGVLIRCYLSRLNRAVRYFMDGVEETIFWGSKMQINTGEYLGFTVFLGEQDNSPEISKLVELSRDAKLFADIGGNIGLIAIPLAINSPNLEVHAFEPDIRNRLLFEKNLRLNPTIGERLKIVPKAVGELNGEVLFHSDSDNFGTGRIVAEKINATCSVISTTADAYFATLNRYPDLIKIDVEGAELMVLKGMKDILLHHPPFGIFVEIHSYSAPEPNLFKEEIRHILMSSGYRLYHPYIGEKLEQALWEDPAQWPMHFPLLALHINWHKTS